MRKSTVMAKCLVNSNMIPRLEDAGHSVHQVFLDEFPRSALLKLYRSLLDFSIFWTAFIRGLHV